MWNYFILFVFVFFFQSLNADMKANQVSSAGERVVVRADLLEKADASKILFEFKKSVVSQGETKLSFRRFTDPSGALIAEEKLEYLNGKLKRLELNHLQIVQRGTLIVDGDELHFQYTKDGVSRTDSEKLDGELVSTDEIYPFLNRNWEKLMKGETISIRLPVLERMETVGFKFFKDKDADLNGLKATVIKMKPSSFVIAAIVDPILFYFHPTETQLDGHKVIQIVGRTVPKRLDGKKWKDLDVIMKFK